MLASFGQKNVCCIIITLLTVISIAGITLWNMPTKPLINFTPTDGFTLARYSSEGSQFRGWGTDLDFPETTKNALAAYHPSLYRYQYENIQLDYLAEVNLLTLSGDIVWLDINTSEIGGRAKLKGIGHIQGADATIAYRGELHSDSGTDFWTGTFTLKLPPYSSVHGYFLTKHADDYPNTDQIESSDKYAIGSIFLERVLELDHKTNVFP